MGGRVALSPAPVPWVPARWQGGRGESRDGNPALCRGFAWAPSGGWGKKKKTKERKKERRKKERKERMKGKRKGRRKGRRERRERRRRRNEEEEKKEKKEKI